MDIANAYKQQQQITHLREQIAEVRKELKQVNLAYKLAFVGTFVLYFAFVWMMYVADLWGFTTWLTQNFSEIAALIVFGILSIALPLTMALIKEIGYQHFSTYQNPFWLIVLIVGILALAGVVYESIVSSSQQQHMSHSKAENSKTFAAISNTPTAPASTGSMAAMIASAESKLATCRKRVERGAWKDCAESEARLQSYRDSEQRAMTSAERTSAAAIEAKTSAIQQLKEDAFKPVFKSIRDSLGVTINTGIMLVTMFISIIFEISHLLLILFGGQKRRRLEGLKQALIQLEANYLEQTGKKFNPDDFKDESVLDMDDLRQQPDKPAMGFGQPATANYGAPVRFKYQAKQSANKPSFGFVDTNQRPAQAKASTPQLHQPTTGTQTTAKATIPGLGTEEEQLPLPQLSTWNRELSGHGIDSPPDDALNQSADKAQIERIIQRGLQTGNPEPETLSKPLAKGQETGSEKPDQQTVSKPLANGRKTGLYEQWLQAVRVGQCKPSVKPTWEWIQKRISNCETGSRTHDRTRISTMQKAFFHRAMHDGLMKQNPNYRNGGKKFLWIETGE